MIFRVIQSRNACHIGKLLLAVVCAVGAESISGQQQPDSTKALADSAKAASSAALFMASYDPKILEEIQKSPTGYFVNPGTTVVPLDSGAFAKLSALRPVVWLQLKLERNSSVKDSRVIYCSGPGKGLERLALEAAKKGEFHAVDEHEDWRWLYLRVVFAAAKTMIPEAI